MVRRLKDTEEKNGHDDVIEGKIFALLSYLSILCILPLLFNKNNPFALHHGKQGLVLFVGEVAGFILHIVLGVWLLKLSAFVFGILSFIGIISVLQGRYQKLPVIFEIAETISL